MSVNLSSDGKLYFSRKVQIFIALDKLAIEKNSELFDLEEIIDLSTVNTTRKNTFAFAVAVEKLNLKHEEAEKMLEEK
jgi:hypothetical protein